MYPQMKTKNTKKSLVVGISLVILGLIIVNKQMELHVSNILRPLTDAYAYSKGFVGDCHKDIRVSVSIGNNGSMSLSYTICSNADGVYLSGPYDPFQSETTLIPWNDISTDMNKRLSPIGWIEVRFRKVPDTQISLPEEVWKELLSQRKS